MQFDIPSKSPREQLAAMTRERILEAVARILRRGSEVTFDQVAKESGIPQRTLYRYFENKDALFAAFWDWANATIEVPALPTSPGDLIEHIPALYAAFDRDEALVRAMMHDPHGRRVRMGNADARRAKFRDALKPLIAGLDEEDATGLLASVSAICSASGWEMIKDNWHLKGPAAARAAQWGVASLIAEARRKAGTAADMTQGKIGAFEGDRI